MTRYQHAARTSGTTAVATWELRTAASPRIRIVEIGIFMGAATASTFGLGRPAAIGVTPTSPVLGQAMDPADAAAVSSTALAWGTAPTAPTSAIYLRRIGLPGVIGAGVIWTFPDASPLIVAVGSSIVIYNLAVNGVADIYAVWDE